MKLKDNNIFEGHIIIKVLFFNLHSLVSFDHQRAYEEEWMQQAQTTQSLLFALLINKIY